MSRWFYTSLFCLALAVPASAGESAGDIEKPSISGDYLEARTADVYTGPCFANAEVNLTGKEAVMAWKVREGKWQGVDVSGLSVVAVVKAKATLGDPFANPLPARSVILVDEKADAAQREALVAFAKSMGGELLSQTEAVKAAPIRADFAAEAGFAALEAGDAVEVRTRALNHHDHLCGNEYVYYEPLTQVVNAVPAYTLAHAYRGEDFNSTWSCPLKRSAFVAQFSR